MESCCHLISEKFKKQESTGRVVWDQCWGELLWESLLADNRKKKARKVTKEETTECKGRSPKRYHSHDFSADSKYSTFI